MARNQPGTRRGRAAALVGNILNLPKTCRLILDALAGAGRHLTVGEIVRRVKRSERSVRSHLGILISRRILTRDVGLTAARRLAYTYALRPVSGIIADVRGEMVRRLAELEAAVSPRKKERSRPQRV